MNRTSLFVTAGGLFVLVAAGCQAIAGLQDRTPDPLPTNACALPSSGNGRVRLVNLANVGAGLATPSDPLNYSDFCIKPSSSSDWGRPIFRDGGIDQLCLGTSSQPGGLEYGEATVPFSVPVGNIDVKAVPSGKTCSAAATSQVLGVNVPDSTKGGGVVTLIRWGGGSTAEGLAAHAEDVTSTFKAGASYIRPMNALSGNKAISFGVANDPFLPTTLSDVIIPSIAPGDVAPASNPTFGAIDAQGYEGIINASLPFATGYAGDTTNTASAVFVGPGDTVIGTLYVVGDPTDTQNLHPVRGLFCQDAKVATADDGGTGGNLQQNVSAADQTLFQECAFTNLPILSIDMVNTSFYGANSPFQSQREAPVDSAIAARRSDLMCIVEVDDSSTRNDVISKVNPPNATTTPQYPYNYITTPETTETTQPTDPNYPVPAPNNPPCAGSVNPNTVQAAVACVEQNCDTVTSGEDAGSGFLNGTTACISQHCSHEFALLYSAVATSPSESANNACFDCLLVKVSSNETIAASESECMTEAQAPYAFEGQVPSMILSHYPIVAGSGKTYVFPSTAYRRAILKAQIQLEDQKIDFFCAQFISPLIDQSLPYTGSFGSDAVLADGGYQNGFEQEQDLESTLAIAWIKAEQAADGVPAIIAADLHSTDALQNPTAGALVNLSPEVQQAFAAALTPADPANYAHPCDYCPAPANPYNAGTEPYELMHAYTIGFPAHATQTETFWGNDNSAVPITSLPNEQAPTSGFGPLFEYWAHNYEILRP